jgi:hypothetical protein
LRYAMTSLERTTPNLGQSDSTILSRRLCDRLARLLSQHTALFFISQSSIRTSPFGKPPVFRLISFFLRFLSAGPCPEKAVRL